MDSRQVAQGLFQRENVADLEDLLVGRRPGRDGMVLQDTYTGAAVLALARAQGPGVELPY